MPEPNSSSCNRQLDSGSLHKQTRRNSLSRDVRSPVEDHDMVSPLSHNIKSQTHSRVSECDGRPPVQVQPSAVNRMVTASTDFYPSVKQISDFFMYLYQDFSPSAKQISDFFMYLYQDLNRRPSIIDGYRTAIVDTLGPTAHHIAHNADLHRLLSSFYRDCPKSSRNLPKWNLSVVLNELTKAPFQPMKDTDLKYLTLKTAFLLVLATSKRRSEIHAWVANKVSNLGQWEKVSLFPSSDFIAKNQLAREGSQSVSPVTIPALTTIVDRQFKEDRTLCPVRALRYYLDRTKDLRGSRSLLFISFKKGQTSDPLLCLPG